MTAALNEGYPSDWARVTLMVSPTGEMHAIGGDREPGEGDVPYIGLKRIRAALASPPGAPVAGIYVASRVARAPLWQSYRAQGYPIIASWIDEAGDGDTDDFGELWARIESEIVRCKALIFYAGGEGDFPFKGAFVEIGMALAHRKPIYVVLENVTLRDRTMRPIGSWILDRRVNRCDSLDEAFRRALASPTPPAQEGKETINAQGDNNGKRPFCNGETSPVREASKKEPELPSVQDDVQDPARQTLAPAGGKVQGKEVPLPDSVTSPTPPSEKERERLGDEREGFYEKLWKDFVSLQRGDAVGTCAKVERYYREQESRQADAPVGWVRRQALVDAMEAAAKGAEPDWNAFPASQREFIDKQTAYSLGHGTGLLAAVQAIKTLLAAPPRPAGSAE